MTGDLLLAEYRRRGWSLVPIPAGEKGPRSKDWQTRQWQPSDFPPGCNAGLILGPRSGEIVDVDLDCGEALQLADRYLLATGAIFGRPSKPRSHWFYTALGAVFETFADPVSGETILELRARGATGGEHQTLLPPSVADGERREWAGDAIAPAVVHHAALRCTVAWLAIGALVMRYVSQHAAERPGPDLPRLLWEADPALGRAAYRWLGQPDPDAPKYRPKPQRDLSREDLDLAEIVAAIPNNCDWNEWVRIGLAIYGASGGSDQGGIAFDDFSSRSAKYNPYETGERWRHFHRSPPDRIGLGTLIHLARAAGWQPPARRAAK